MTKTEFFLRAVTVISGALIVREVLTFKEETLTERIQTSGGAMNNPGNIKKPNGVRDLFKGELVLVDGSPFSSFSDMTKGSRAIARIVKTKYNNGITSIDALVRSYDPVASEETKVNYGNLVADFAGINKMDNIGTDTSIRAKIVEGIIRFEQGRDWYTAHENNISGWATAGTNMA